MKTQIIFPVLSVVVGSIAGFMLGKGSPDKSNSAEPVAELKSFTRRSSSVQSSGAGEGKEASKRVRNLEEALGKKSQIGRLEALMSHFASLSPSAFAEEADKLDELPMSDRMFVSFLLFAQWGEVDPLGAMSYTKKMGRMGGFVNGTVLKSWASTNLTEAAEYYTANAGDFNTVGGRDRSGASVIATEWALEDRDAALAWAQGLEGKDSAYAISSIFNQVAASDPAGASLLLSSISDEAARIKAQNTVARQWGAKDWSAAEAWIFSLPVDQQSDAMVVALEGLSDVDYLAAAGKLSALADTEAFADTMESIAKDWSRDDPAAASAWIMENGNLAAKVESIGTAVASWSKVDQAAAYDFVSQQEIGEVRDAAVSAYIDSNRNGDTNTNLDLAETVTDSSDRARAISRSISDWIKEDKDAATNYVNTSDLLTDDQKVRVIERAAEGHRGGRRRR